MKTAGKLFIGAVVLGGLALIGTQVAKAAGKKKPGGGGTDVTDPTFNPFDKGDDGPGGGGGGGGGGGSGGGGGGGGSGGGGGTLGPGGFRTYGGPNGGLVFGHMSDAGIANVDWLPNGNTVRFSSDCTVVLVGRQVWRMGDTIAVDGQDPVHHLECVEYSDVKSCWRHGQNLCCFIDYLMNQENITSARSIGAALLKGMEPPCIDAPYSSWPQAMQDFVDWLREHVNEFVLEAGGQADW